MENLQLRNKLTKTGIFTVQLLPVTNRRMNKQIQNSIRYNTVGQLNTKIVQNINS